MNAIKIISRAVVSRDMSRSRDTIFQSLSIEGLKGVFATFLNVRFKDKFPTVFLYRKTHNNFYSINLSS